MNKNDIKLLLSLIVLIICLFIFVSISNSNLEKKALVYFEDKLVLTIDLSNNENKTYSVNGLLGEVVIEKDNDKVRILKENSPNHICSKQGYIKNNYEVLVCLPNKVVVKIENQDDIDTIVK